MQREVGLTEGCTWGRYPSLENRPRGRAWESPSSAAGAQGDEGGDLLSRHCCQTKPGVRDRGEQLFSEDAMALLRGLWSPGMGENLPHLEDIGLGQVCWAGDPGRGPGKLA